MPAPVQHSASPLKSLHLLRSLLREASYLPDATARSYFRRYIVHRFKAYQPKQNATASHHVDAVQRYRHRSFRRRQPAVIEDRTRPMLRKAHKGLTFLRRANQGEMLCLQKVLWFAYGRLGRRKYALLNDLLKPDPPTTAHAPLSTDEALAPLQACYYSDKRFLQYFDAPRAATKTHHVIGISNRYSRLRTVLTSQCQKSISIGRALKSPTFKTPINNVWERPMPMKRARNNLKRWYAMTLTRLLPPLPTEEWNAIRAMIAGEKHIDFAKPRVRALDSAPSQVSAEAQFEAFLNAGLTLDRPSKADRPWGVQRPHAINVKFMRRLYTRILLLCCKLEYDEEHKQWRAVWGDPSKAIKPKLYNLAETDASLFAGVDTSGRIVKKTGLKEGGGMESVGIATRS
ncbi:hypothetical protein ACN47E_001843 [Coniothyrium glycines]